MAILVSPTTLTAASLGPAIGGDPRSYLAIDKAGVVLCCNPKAASTSIIAAVKQALGVFGGPMHLHPELDFVTKREMQQRYPRHRRAIFVREPLSRLLAVYHYHCHQTRMRNCTNMRERGFRAGMPFAEFLDLVRLDPEGDPHYARQTALMPTPSFVGRIENLDAAWQQFSAWTGLALPPVRWLNRGTAVDVSGVTEAQRAEIIDLYRADYNAFGYAED